MIGPYSYWQAAMLMRSDDLDDMRDAFSDDGPHDALGHKTRRGQRAEMPRSSRQSSQT